MLNRWSILAAACGLLFLAGCGSSKQVTRLEADTTTDLSGEWNDTDSRLVANEMIGDVMASPWVGEFTKAEKRKPTVIVGKITNRTTEHIEVKTFVKDLERAMLNSGQVDFVADAGEREQLRDERKDQAQEGARRRPRRARGRNRAPTSC